MTKMHECRKCKNNLSLPDRIAICKFLYSQIRTGGLCQYYKYKPFWFWRLPK